MGSLMDLDSDDPINYGLLAAASGLLTPVSQGGGMGAAFGRFGQTVSAERNNNQANELRKLQIEAQKRAMKAAPSRYKVVGNNIWDEEMRQFITSPEKPVAEKLPAAEMQIVNAMYPEGDSRRPVALQKLLEKHSTHAPMTPQFNTVPGATGYHPVDARTGAIGPEQGSRPPVTAEVPKTPTLAPHLSKKLVSLDEANDAQEMVTEALNAAKAINKQAWAGPIASIGAQARSMFPGKSAGADATIEYQNIINTQAVQSLKLLFGGQPTEGERKVLLELQASVDKQPDQREKIIDRATAMAADRITRNQRLGEQIRAGRYGGEGAPPSAPSAAPTNRGFRVVRD